MIYFSLNTIPLSFWIEEAVLQFQYIKNCSIAQNNVAVVYRENALKFEQFQQKIVIPACHISFSLYSHFAVVFFD
jgi:hypothetical protein